MPQESNTNCDMVKKPLTLDEAIAHVEEEVARNPESPFKREHRQLAEWLRELRKRRDDAVGDAAKLREALSKSCAYFAVVLNTGMFNRVHLEALLNMAKAALSAPPRNCDVYTSDELKAKFNSELASELPIANEHEKNLVAITAMGVIDTLLAPVTEKEGGNDADK